MTNDLHASARGPRTRLLVVDDETAVLELMVMVLERAGYPCLSAENGQEALAIFRRRRLEIRGVVTDMNMPGIDGFALIRGVRAIASDTKIILSSGSLGEADKRIAADLGVSGFLAKPWTSPQLASCVRSILESEANLVGVECESGAA